MDVLSVSEAWAIAQETFGEVMVYENATSYYSSVAQLMQAQGWTAVTKGSEVLYYTKPAQAALTTGVKTYTQVAEVTSVTAAESGAVTGATATTTGVGVTVAEAAIGSAVAACLGYNVGNKIYEANPDWWDGLLAETNEWIVENVPEGGVNAIVTVLEGVDTVLTFPSDLINRIKTYILDSGIEVEEPTQNIPVFGVAFNGSSASFTLAYLKNMAYKAKRIAHYNNYWKTVPNSDLDSIVFDVYDRIIADHASYNSDKEICVYSVYLSRDGYAFFQYNVGTLDDIIMYENRNSAVQSPNCYPGARFRYRRTFFEVMDRSYPVEGVITNDNFYIGQESVQVSSFNSSIEGSVKGVTKQEDAIRPLVDVSISERYPDWWNRRKIINNGEGNSTDWLPVSIPSLDPVTLGNPQTQVQAQSGTDTDTENNPNIEVADSSGVNNKDNNPDSTDNGNTPIVAPLTSLYGIAGIYNPTLEQITSFSNWLWSENPITQLQQMFSNPMNAIIGLHLIYATPHTSSAKSIGVGYLNSGILSKVVDKQYITIDCGTVDIPSYYNNVNDWNPYTKISCYLPFIGIVKLNTDDLMSSKDKFSQLNITYKVDVLTGACLAMLKVKRGNSDAVLYQYNGSCSVQLPLTSGNYGSALASLISTVVGGASGFAPLAIGGIMGLAHSKADIQRSGQLGANVGAMGIKKPYLIIERPYSKYAGSYAKHIGYPSNNTIKLSACSGFTRVKSTDVNNINTTEEERKMILNLLTDGIYI